MKVFIIGVEQPFRRMLWTSLEEAGFDVTLATSGAQGLQDISRHRPDIIVLDLDQCGGREVCRQLRCACPALLIVLSQCAAEPDKIAALDAGADDYLTKPCSVDELLARLRAMLRRTRTGLNWESHQFVAGDLQIDFLGHRVTRGGQEVRLTYTEYELLKHLAQHQGHVLTYRELLEKIRSRTDVEDVHALRVHIGHLRRKVELDPAQPQFIHTERRTGYRFQGD